MHFSPYECTLSIMPSLKMGVMSKPLPIYMVVTTHGKAIVRQTLSDIGWQPRDCRGGCVLMLKAGVHAPIRSGVRGGEIVGLFSGQGRARINERHVGRTPSPVRFISTTADRYS